MLPEEQEDLKSREERLMMYIWDNDLTFTSRELADMLEGDGWNSVTVFKALKSLCDKGFIETVGVQRASKTYARKLTAALSKEEYLANLAVKRGAGVEFFETYACALTGGGTRKVDKKAVIESLQKIIDGME